MSTPLDCPSLECWQMLFDDSVSPAERERYERHLESCLACQERLDWVEELGGTLRGLAREVGDPTVAPADPTLEQFLERLHESKQADPITSQEPADLFFLRPTDRPELLGTLGDYEVQEVIGQGGMGVVLKAFEPALHRLVAIKVLAAALAGSAVARRRFTREAQAAAAVCHDHIVPVHGVHEVDGLPYLVMQYVPGESLQARLDRVGPLPLLEIVRIGLQTASGLAAAHAQGLIHRDIKPANLLLEGEPGALAPGVTRVKITDFGLARMVDDVGLTQNGVVAGTPEYMAPEQAKGEHIDHRADLFSLGSVLYALCTGQPPFRGSTTAAVLHKVSTAAALSVRELNPDVPAWLDELIARLLAKEPDQRVQTAAEVLALLEGYLAHLRQPGVAAPVLPLLPLPPAEQGDTKMLLLTCSECGKSLKVKTELAGRKVKCPQCGQAVRVAEPEVAVADRPRFPAWKVAACAALGLVLLFVGVKLFLSAKRAGRSFLDVPLGHKMVEGVEDSGFYHDEHNNVGPFRWTDGNGKLVIPLSGTDRPRALRVHLQRPKTTWLKIKVNGRELVNEPVADIDVDPWQQTLDLDGIELGTEIVVEVISNPLVGRDGDPRPLGVKVRGVTLLREPTGDTAATLGSFLDIPLGNRSVPGVEDSGFYYDERVKDKPLRWTNGTGRLVIPLTAKDRPQALLVELGLPKNRSLRITVNNRELVNEKTTEQTPWLWERMLDLSGIDLGEKVVVEILSNTSVPEKDKRSLGVMLRGLRLLSRPPKYTDLELVGGRIPRVIDSGFYTPETFAGKPCRWTNGSARVTVPISGETPRTLAISAWIPEIPKYRVRVAINGKTLFDEQVKSNGIWSCELPLSGVNLGDSACIELDSSTFVPATVAPHPADDRKLGIRLTRLILLADSAEEKK